MRYETSLYITLLCLLSDLVSVDSKYPVDNSKNPDTTTLQCFFIQQDITLEISVESDNRGLLSKPNFYITFNIELIGSLTQILYKKLLADNN